MVNTDTVDTAKRKTLKVLGGSAVIAVAPGIISANTLQGGETTGTANEAAMEEITVPVTASGTELTISLSVDPEPVVRLTNHSRQLIIVRHVYPGIVEAGNQSFDINSIFERCAYAIRAGSSRNVLIEPASGTSAETNFPRHLYRSKPQRIAAVTGRDHNGRLAKSSRSFFA